MCICYTFYSFLSLLVYKFCLLFLMLSESVCCYTVVASLYLIYHLLQLLLISLFGVNFNINCVTNSSKSLFQLYKCYLDSTVTLSWFTLLIIYYLISIYFLFILLFIFYLFYYLFSNIFLLAFFRLSLEKCIYLRKDSLFHLPSSLIISTGNPA